jgi:signal transduction histidine kinase
MTILPFESPTEEQANPSDFMSEMGIDMPEIERRLAFIGLTQADVTLLIEMRDFARGHADEIVTRFYQHLLSFRETRALLKDQQTIDRLITSQKKYLMEIFEGRFDQSYFEQRLMTGKVHYRIGLEPKWYMSSYSFYEKLLSEMISEAYRHEADKGMARSMAVKKVFRIDMVLAIEAYFYVNMLDVRRRLDENLKEMDDFTRMVSHDLKEPLRGIETFSGFLLEDYSEGLDAQGLKYLRFLNESALRMKSLIQDLLTLVSISKKGNHLERVDLGMLLKQVKKDLKFAIDQKKAVIDYALPLPEIDSDPILLTEVLKNLISNGIKFNVSEPPRVRLAVSEGKSEALFSVKDNGIGIPESYQKQILRPFERLHPQDAFEGTGVGLAICRKIVEGQGGKIWLESEPGEGSTFYFTLPRT